MDWTMSPRSRPKPLVAFPWGSRSTTRTASPARARYVARLTTVVVLPTPPFWLAQAMIWPTQVPISVIGTVKFYHSGPLPGSRDRPRALTEVVGPAESRARLRSGYRNGIDDGLRAAYPSEAASAQVVVLAREADATAGRRVPRPGFGRGREVSGCL